MNFAMTAIATPRVANAVVTTPSSASAILEHRKLTDAAQQFEGMLLQEMLKPMKEHGFCEGDGDEDSDSKEDTAGLGDTLSSYGAETMATAIAKSGGLGIARHVVEQVEGERAAHAEALKTKELVLPK